MSARTVLYLDHTAKLSGGEIALARLLEALDRTRVTPVVLLAEDGPLVTRLREIGVETHVLPLAKSIREIRKDTLGAGAALRYAGRAFVLAAYSFRVARWARRRGADILHTNSLKSDLYGALAGRLARIPVVWHVRDHIDSSYLPGPAVRVFRTLSRRLPTYVVTNSFSTLDRLFLRGARPSAVVPSGVAISGGSVGRVVHDGLAPQQGTPTHLADENNETAPWKGPVRIGIVGRLAPWKGQHVFLEAAAGVTAAGHGDTRFVIVGSPLFGEESYGEQLRRQAETLGIAPRVEFLGFQKDVPAVLQSLDILVHASTTPEPFGQVVIEGMAEGLPVIGTDGGGVREIITHGENGLLVPMGDARALTRALETLLRDPAMARRLGRAGYHHVRQHFTVAQSARKVEQVYDEVLAVSTRRGGTARRTL
jgi:glycosyltransferase involved in cell wall biosynthesis